MEAFRFDENFKSILTRSIHLYTNEKVRKPKQQQQQQQYHDDGGKFSEKSDTRSSLNWFGALFLRSFRKFRMPSLFDLYPLSNVSKCVCVRVVRNAPSSSTIINNQTTESLSLFYSPLIRVE